MSCAFSIQIRCICSLTLLAFCGKASRSILRAVVLVYILSGPVQNIGNNAKEVIRVFACSAVLTYNLTRTGLDLMMAPFNNAVIEMRKNMTDMKDKFAEVVDAVQPIVNEIEGSKLEDDPIPTTTTTPNNNTEITSASDVLDSQTTEMMNVTATTTNPPDPGPTEAAIITATAGEPMTDNSSTTEASTTLSTLATNNSATESTVAQNSINTTSLEPNNSTLNRLARSGEFVKDANVYQQNYVAKIEGRCNLQFQKATDKCRNMFDDAYNKCMDKIIFVVNSLLCWPMKITVICNIKDVSFSKWLYILFLYINSLILSRLWEWDKEIREFVMPQV